MRRNLRKTTLILSVLRRWEKQNKKASGTKEGGKGSAIEKLCIFVPSDQHIPIDFI